MPKGTNRRTSLELYHINPQDVKKSQAWFDEQVAKLSTKKITPNRLMYGDGGSTLTSRLMPGKMYFFYYSAKHQDTLPYWDQFPLVIPFTKHKDGFTGLNFHYLGYRERMLLIKELDRIMGTGFGETRKLEMVWGLVNSMSKLGTARACVKRYLTSHVKSPYCEVPYSSWYTAMMMPVQRFVGATKEHVWSESRNI